MIHDPDVLIMDEPTSGLDPNQIVEIRNLIKRLGRAKTVILSTHILSEVQATCDRVIIINEGSIVADGSPEDLQRRFTGGEVVTVEVKTSSANPLEDVAQRLRVLAYVSGVTLVSHQDGVTRLELQVDKGQDVREAIFRLTVSEHWVILELHRKVTTLEEVFHKLTAA
jgi:ABC-2 type transport system ATP-binding protein